MQLCLGTVQFGLDYGIIGQKKPSLEYSVKCLDYATQNGIYTIDTAAAYGTAEEITGAFLRKRTIPRKDLFVCSKMLPNVLDNYSPKEYYQQIKKHLLHSLEVIGTDYLDAYMLHSARYAHKPEVLQALQRMQTEGFVRKVGVSVYDPDEAKACIESPYVDFMQLPYSIFDHRMKADGVFKTSADDNVQIHARSAFIQGLILLEEEQVPPFLQEAKPILKQIKTICQEHQLNRVALAMAYIKKEPRISHLVFGVDSLEQLKEDIDLFQRDIPAAVLDQISKEFADIKAEVVMPSLWKR